MRRDGETTRAAIKEAALQHFSRSGYERTALEDVAADLGITRSAILFHFGSKGELLRELAQPLEDDLDRILDQERGPVPLTRAARKKLLAELFDCYIAHRSMVVLLTRDISSHAPIDIDPRAALRSHRLFHLLAGPNPSERDHLTIRMIVGAFINPLADPGLAVDKPELTRILLDAAMLLARQFDAARLDAKLRLRPKAASVVEPASEE